MSAEYGKSAFLAKFGSPNHIENVMKDWDGGFPNMFLTHMLSNPSITHEQMHVVADHLSSRGMTGYNASKVLDSRKDIPSDVIEKVAQNFGDDPYIQKSIASHANVTKQAMQHMIDHEHYKFPKRQAVIDSMKTIQNRLDK